MGFATHLGPWLLGTNRYTTGTTATTLANTGCTVVSQSFPVVFGTLTGSPIAVPAGSQIVDVKVVTTTVFSSAATAYLDIGGTAFTTTGTITNVGSVALGANATTPAGWVNVGTSDVLINYTMTGTALTTGAATIIVTYSVRNSDGSQRPSGTQN
jgi:hypothetical protein